MNAPRIFFVAFAAIVAISLASCRDATTPPPIAATTALDSADQFMVGVESKVTEGGVLRADVEADTAYLYDNGVRIEMRQTNAKFYTSTGVQNSTMTANRTVYDTRADTIQAFGNVRVVGVDGRTLTTPFLRYNKALDQISSDSIFTMTSADQTIHGIGFDSDPGMTALHVRKVIKVTGGSVTVPDR